MRRARSHTERDALGRSSRIARAWRSRANRGSCLREMTSLQIIRNQSHFKLDGVTFS
jgi:hypothetical protein